MPHHHGQKERAANFSGSLTVNALYAAADYLDFGVVSSFSGFAMLLPEPVVCALDFIALEFIAFAWCLCL